MTSSTGRERHFPGAQPRLRWAAQDYESHNLIPFVGADPARASGSLRMATGFGKWGLSNGPAAALRLTAEITRTPCTRSTRVDQDDRPTA